MSHFMLNQKELPFTTDSKTALPIWTVVKGNLEEQLGDPVALNWSKNTQFDGQTGQTLLVPDHEGQIAGAVFGLGHHDALSPLLAGKLAKTLPEGDWQFSSTSLNTSRMALGFGLGAYQFDRYKKNERKTAKLSINTNDEMDDIKRQVAGCYLAKDLINTPTNDMGPDALEGVFNALAEHYQAKIHVIKGDDLLDQNFPLIHTVGRASAEAPRLLDMAWGDPTHPKITLVGKGVCFDTGGLNIKPGSSMGLMKKDMGGAANVLGLALMIMDAKLPVRLRVLIPAVENSISANAFRPSDILTSRKGLTVQIDNTDAEGRLVLADALALACEETPDLLIDMATLTGAARVALGPDLPPFFTDNENFADDLAKASIQEDDPLWRLPLYKGYEADIGTSISDLTNAPSGGFAGAITAALFLKRFVEAGIEWAHFDIYGWNPKDKPHSPAGGEAQAIRALYGLLKGRYQS